MCIEGERERERDLLRLLHTPPADEVEGRVKPHTRSPRSAIWRRPQPV